MAKILEQIRATYQPEPEPKLELVHGFVKGRVSIIMPAYNESDCICKSVADVRNQFGNVCTDYEIIVVDDGSTDDTRRLVESLSDPKLRVVGYDRNHGKGHAFRMGFRLATGEFTFLVDSDSEIRAKELITYFEALGSTDIAIGSKRHPRSVVRTPIIRRILSLGFNVFERLLTGVRAKDTQAGFKGAKSSVFYQILPLITAKRYSFDLEFLAVASLFDFKVYELPVFIDLKALVDPRRVFRMVIDVLGIAYRLRITRWYQKNIMSMSDTYDPMIKW